MCAPTDVCRSTMTMQGDLDHVVSSRPRLEGSIRRQEAGNAQVSSELQRFAPED